MATDLAPLLADLRAEQADLRAVVEPAEIDQPTPAAGWSIRDAISHLVGTDVEATLAARDPDAFVAKLPSVGADIDGFVTDQLSARRDLPKFDLIAQWQQGFESMVEAVGSAEPSAKLPWYGPPMSPASFVTARIMEYWAHGQDIVDALGIARPGTDRLRHICHLGVRTRGFAYANRGLPAPTEPVAVRLTSPKGQTWSYGDPDAADQVSGPALDFCLLVTQRRHRDDTALVARGASAQEWLSIAQCFAGPPGAGRPPR
ncbi:MAG TPA: TIGR03084 family metal-binding protein [Mycobacteriales bacterium]|nr:TIGR03084 family metal-binding protein [Mycobacteriales bacterium]